MAKGDNGGSFPLPPTGNHPALCIDVIDLGDIETPFKIEKGPKAGQPRIAHQIQLVWQIAPEDEDSGQIICREDGRPFRISKFYTLSLNERATLRADLESWRGLPFTDEDLMNGFDVEKLIGVQCQLNLVGKKNKAGKDVVVVKSISPKHRRDPKIAVDPEFQRELTIPGGRDVRSPKADPVKQVEAGLDNDDEDLPEDDDLPF